MALAVAVIWLVSHLRFLAMAKQPDSMSLMSRNWRD